MANIYGGCPYIGTRAGAGQDNLPVGTMQERTDFGNAGYGGAGREAEGQRARIDTHIGPCPTA